MAKIHTLTYNGTKSSDLGVFVTGSGSFDAAELDVDKYEIPGRNGDLILSNNRYKNIEITYPAFIPKAFMDKAQNVRNWLRSSRVYARLEDTYDTDHYRLGIPTGVQSFEPANRNDGANFEMTFDCKPQRFLKSGETPETVEADVQTESGEIVTFETIAESPMTSAEVSLSPIQSGSGTPSPTNIRPISGHTGAELKIGATYPTAINTYSVTFSDQGTVYGGTFDWVSGKLMVEYGSYTFTGSESWTKGSYPWGYDTSITANGYSTTISGIKSSAKANIISDTFVLSSTTARNLRAAIEWSRVDCCINNVVGFDYIVIRYDSITDSATFAQYMAGKTIVYELETPLEYTLSPQQIETLLGENNVWSDAGPITLTYAEPFTIENPTQFEARPLFIITNPNQGDALSVSGKTITFVDGYTGTVFIDCETMNAYSGAANLNSIIQATDFPVLVPGTNIITWTGTGVCTMTPRWWEL